MPSRQPARTPALPKTIPISMWRRVRTTPMWVGLIPGSMGLCREIYQEGLRIPPVRIMRAGKMERDVLALLLNNVRTPHEREGDLGAQIAACHTGRRAAARDLRRVTGWSGRNPHRAELLDYSERMMRAFLERVPTGTYRAEDFLDSDGISDRPVRIAVAVTFQKCRGGRGRPRPHLVTVDFTGSDPQVEGSINAVEAITYSACFYVFRCLLADDVPATAGLMRPDPGDCAERDGGECAASGGGGGRKCRDLAAHRGRSAAGAWRRLFQIGFRRRLREP